MKSFMVLLFPLLCVVIAGILAFHGTSGWGWFLFAAIMGAGADTVKKYASNDK